ncbi:response regulator transcription factor [Halodesulfovibrio marinisediminis]|uniref:Two-component system, OmpR family, response regulator CpxR n=1 Tax=Halodesulfovibrio marinisediminis DSM 17456 TaxID=1121457 RepID=A0A1N6GTH0_9BACT|nr:response regulator transcription factor [Halodesulfovibrio marinisediminis]SIO10826.1 two-component system, OmpR family, response regulator CpxR [Halodesulfovibrio marinisediminis DSM 17456]
MKRILFIDDDFELGELLGSYLSGEGFSLQTAHDAQTGIEKLKEDNFDIVLLDIMLPDMNGFDLLQKIRNEYTMPVIMLTGRSDEIDKVVGLEMGADDYVAKPCPLRELAARIRAILRRTMPVKAARPSITATKIDPAHKIIIGNMSLTPSARSVQIDDSPVQLTSAEYNVLEMLTSNAGILITREQLLEDALGRDPSLDDYVLNVHMSNLRRKLRHSATIKTIRGNGYLLAIPDHSPQQAVHM